MSIFVVYILYTLNFGLDYMMQRKTYKVAGHVFCLEMRSDSHIWERAEESYGPFETAGDEEETLFNVSLCDEPVTDSSAVMAYTNKDSVEPGFITLTVYRSSKGHYFEFTQPGSAEVNGKLFINNSLNEARLSLYGNEFSQWLTFNTGVNFCYLLSTSCLGTVLTHASCVKYKRKAYLFLGKSGTGKSTHSRMWLEALEGVMLMNDDHPVIRIDGNGQAIAYGSPWSGKTRCYKNIEAPVGAIVRISRARYNKARRLSPIEAYASLMTSCSGMTWEPELADGRYRTIQAIISSSPCWVMECLPDADAARVCSKAVTEQP